MKQSKHTKMLNLGKVTVQDLTILGKSELDAVKGGSFNPRGITNPPIYCS